MEGICWKLLYQTKTLYYNTKRKNTNSSLLAKTPNTNTSTYKMGPATWSSRAWLGPGAPLSPSACWFSSPAVSFSFWLPVNKHVNYFLQMHHIPLLTPVRSGAPFPETSPTSNKQRCNTPGPMGARAQPAQLPIIYFSIVNCTHYWRLAECSKIIPHSIMQIRSTASSHFYSVKVHMMKKQFIKSFRLEKAQTSQDRKWVGF